MSFFFLVRAWHFGVFKMNFFGLLKDHLLKHPTAVRLKKKRFLEYSRFFLVVVFLFLLFTF